MTSFPNGLPKANDGPSQFLGSFQYPLLLTWINFNPSMEM